MGGESVYGGDEEEIDVSQGRKSCRRLLILRRGELLTSTRSRIMVRRAIFMFSWWLLTSKGVNAADITKLKQNGIHTVGVGFSHAS
jgi:hypothetical protein